MLNKEILDILACPKCKSSLHITEDEKSLICDKCNKRYPLVDGIPVLLIEKAEPI